MNKTAQSLQSSQIDPADKPNQSLLMTPSAIYNNFFSDSTSDSTSEIIDTVILVFKIWCDQDLQ